jgi:hypothetical protein
LEKPVVGSVNKVMYLWVSQRLGREQTIRREILIWKIVWAYRLNSFAMQVVGSLSTVMHLLVSQRRGSEETIRSEVYIWNIV